MQQQQSTTPSFSFGASPPGSSAFGSQSQPQSQQQQSTTPSFSFGASQPGSSAFGSQSQPQSQQQQSTTPSFSFGASQPGSSAFGSQSQPQSQQQQSTTPSFSFGTSQQFGSSPFGATQPTTTTPSFSFSSQPAQSSFGTSTSGTLPPAAPTLSHITSHRHLAGLSPMVAIQLLASAYDPGPAGVFKWLFYSPKTATSAPATSAPATSSLFGASTFGGSSFGGSSFGAFGQNATSAIVTTKPNDIDDGMWDRAVKNNPDPNKYGIVVIRGPTELKNRIKSQTDSCKQQMEKINQNKQILTQLEDKFNSELFSKISEFQTTQQSLLRRLLKITCHFDRVAGKGKGLQPSEIAIRSKIVDFSRHIDGPQGLKIKLKEFQPQIKSFEHYFKKSKSGSRTLIEKQAIDTVVGVIGEQATAIEVITNLLQKQQLVVKKMKEELDSISK
ncbi:hypothetical protein P9112_011351 [Eukaryota sp. TZLM1-RC]